MSAAYTLQKLLYETLCADVLLNTFIAARVYDRVPADSQGNVTATFPYVSFGSYDFVPDDADCIAAGEHTQQIDIWSRAVGRVEAKQITDAVRHALHERHLIMDGFGLVQMRVIMAQVMGDPDGLSSHGIVQVTADIEEPL